jgi:GTP-binding protein Era
MENTKAGFVTILGLPNAGKSTLMNVLLGQKISITTAKPQTTRKRILGILTEQNYQVIFLDTPGILEPGYLLQEKMMEAVRQSVLDSDLILLMLDIQSDPGGEKTLNDKFVAEFLENTSKPVILILNKIDLSDEAAVFKLVNKYESSGKFKNVVPLSALLNFNTGTLKQIITEYLPEHPKFYPDDIVADETERFFVSEIIREKVFELYQEEIPYSTEVIIYDFKEQEGRKDLIQAEIIVERETQKGIIIGKQGAAIKKLGLKAREAIEGFLQREVFLELRVKVRNKWRSDENFLKSFGYSKDKE